MLASAMTQSAISCRFVGSSIADRISKSFETSPKPIQVSMKGRSDVASLFNQVQQAQAQAHERPRAVK